jgi:hypothetical protein
VDRVDGAQHLILAGAPSRGRHQPDGISRRGRIIALIDLTNANEHWRAGINFHSDPS